MLLKMARVRSSDENKDVLILVLLEEIPNNKLTLSLHQLLCIKDYCKWPTDNIGCKLVWKRLSAELRKPVCTDHRYILFDMIVTKECPVSSILPLAFHTKCK